MTDLPALAAALRGIAGAGVGVGVADPRAPAAPLWPEEEGAAVRMVEKRRREFAAGRAAARAAMADLGLPSAAVPMGPNRAPLWPDGCVGSIAHCAAAAVAVIAPATEFCTIGIDIEEATPLEADLWDVVLTPAERNCLARLPEPEQGMAAKRIFSAKEAVYKAQYPLTGQMIGFEDVALTWEPHGFRARLSPVPDLAAECSGRPVQVGSLMLSIVYLP